MKTTELSPSVRTLLARGLAKSECPDPELRVSFIKNQTTPWTEHVVPNCAVRHLKVAEVESLVTKGTLRAPSDASRVFEFIASTDGVDRMGDIVRQNWQLENFKKNPVLLWGHNSWSERSVMGRSIGEEILPMLSGGGGKMALKLWVEFAQLKHNPEAELKFRMYRDGFLKAGSVGFNPRVVTTVKDPEERTRLGLGPWGVIFEESELLEFSLCSVPANADATIQEMLATKSYTPKDIEMARSILVELRQEEEPVEDKPIDEDTPESGANPYEAVLGHLTAAKDEITLAQTMIEELQAIEADAAPGGEEIPGEGEDEDEDEDEDEEAPDLATVSEHLVEASAQLDSAISILDKASADAESAPEEEEAPKGLSEADKKKVTGAVTAAQSAVSEATAALNGTSTEPEGESKPAGSETPEDDDGAEKSTTSDAHAGRVYELLLGIHKDTAE